MQIIGIGACVLDTLLTVPRFPAEDTKLRAISSAVCGGGPAATGIVAAAKTGITAGFIGNLSDDGNGRFLIDDFEKYNVNTDGIRMFPGVRAFTSSIILSRETGTRTCIFDKGTLPPLVLDASQKELIGQASVLLVDGNELSAAVEAAKIARKNGVTVLYDAGGLYEGVEELLSLVDVLIPSEEFALGFTGESHVNRAAAVLLENFSPDCVVITQGKRGGILFEGTNFVPYPIYPAEVVDSNGAGDVFHGAFAAGLARGFSLEKCCHYASAASALKCRGVGARENAPNHDDIKIFLKENKFETK